MKFKQLILVQKKKNTKKYKKIYTKKRTGGHKVKFDMVKTNIHLNQRMSGMSIRSHGLEWDCAANAFLLLGYITEADAIYLAQRTHKRGLSWLEALQILDRAFGIPHVYRQIYTSADALRYLQPGEVTLGVYNAPTVGHFFAIFNHEGTIYIADSYEGVCYDIDRYFRVYTGIHEVALVDSRIAPPAQISITRDIIVGVLDAFNGAIPLDSLIGKTVAQVTAEARPEAERRFGAEARPSRAEERPVQSERLDSIISSIHSTATAPSFFSSYRSPGPAFFPSYRGIVPPALASTPTSAFRAPAPPPPAPAFFPSYRGMVPPALASKPTRSVYAPGTEVFVSSPINDQGTVLSYNSFNDTYSILTQSKKQIIVKRNMVTDDIEL